MHNEALIAASIFFLWLGTWVHRRDINNRLDKVHATLQEHLAQHEDLLRTKQGQPPKHQDLGKAIVEVARRITSKPN